MSPERKIKPYLVVLIFVFGIFLFIFLLDKFIMPAVIHSKPVIKVPLVTGLPLYDALKVLQDASFQFDTTAKQYSETMQENNIVRQVPKPSSAVKQGRTIYITISKGREKVPAPYLIGKTIREANYILKNKGLYTGEITYGFNELIGKDTIISQGIAAGIMIPYGESINIVLSKGSESQVIVPDLYKMNVDEAEKLITSYSLVLGYIITRQSDTFLPKTVIDQYPPPGEIVPVGTAIVLTISK